MTFLVSILVLNCAFGAEIGKYSAPQLYIDLVKERLGKGYREKFVAQHVIYKYKNILPEVSTQVLICIDGSKIWLELTNFEFLVNNKESDKIVTVYLGDVGDTEKARKIAIEIFDPEAVFVFQDVLLRFWDGLLQKSLYPEDSFSSLVASVELGYRAISYHFGFSNSLQSDICLKDIDNFHDFLKFQKSLHKKYMVEMESIDRSVTKDLIDKRQRQGLMAYYPNPFYLGDLVWFLRPTDVNYIDYVSAAVKNFGPNYDAMSCINFPVSYLKQSSVANSNYNCSDSYSPILERLYPAGRIEYTLNGDTKFRFLNRISGYFFRGDSRQIDEVYDANGFWSRVHTNQGEYLFDNAKHKEALLHNDSFWKIGFNKRWGFDPYGSAYLSTSNYFSTAAGYGEDGHVYALAAECGLGLPQGIIGTHTNGRVIDTGRIREIAVPGGMDWKSVVGVRKKIILNERNPANGVQVIHLIGPVFIKMDLASNDEDNFWKILNIVGGKPQCLDSISYLKVANHCIALSDKDLGIGDRNKFFKEILMDALKLEDQDIQGLFDDKDQEQMIKQNLTEYCNYNLLAIQGLMRMGNTHVRR